MSNFVERHDSSDTARKRLSRVVHKIKDVFPHGVAGNREKLREIGFVGLVVCKGLVKEIGRMLSVAKNSSVAEVLVVVQEHGIVARKTAIDHAIDLVRMGSDGRRVRVNFMFMPVRMFRCFIFVERLVV